MCAPSNPPPPHTRTPNLCLASASIEISSLAIVLMTLPVSIMIIQRQRSINCRFCRIKWKTCRIIKFQIWFKKAKLFTSCEDSCSLFLFLISMTRRKKSRVFSETVTQNQRFVAQVKHLRVEEQLCLCRGRKLWILSTRGLCCARGTDVNMERSTLLRAAPDWHTVPHSLAHCQCASCLPCLQLQIAPTPFSTD